MLRPPKLLPDLVGFDHDEPYLLDVLECRDIAVLGDDKAQRLEAPGWAVALARAEVFDRFDPAGRKLFTWAVVWRRAHSDLMWQKATASLCLLHHTPDDRKFLYAWVNGWLHRQWALYCYPSEMYAGAVLRKVQPMEPDE